MAPAEFAAAAAAEADRAADEAAAAAAAAPLVPAQPYGQASGGDHASDSPQVRHLEVDSSFFRWLSLLYTCDDRRMAYAGA